MFLGNLCTNDIKNLPLGGGCEAYFCDSRAKVQFAAWIYHVKLGDGRHAMWVETTPGRNEELVKYLDRYLISEQVEIADVTERFAQLHLAGPKAADVLAKALGEAMPDLPEFAHMERTFGANATCSIRRRDHARLPGLRHRLPARSGPKACAQCSLAAGAVAGTPETFETLRIEAGTPLFGIDIDANRFVMEVGRVARAVSYTKGCFLGQEPIVMARDRAGHVNPRVPRAEGARRRPAAAGHEAVPRRAGSGRSDIELSLAATRCAGRAGLPEVEAPGTGNEDGGRNAHRPPAG